MVAPIRIVAKIIILPVFAQTHLVCETIGVDFSTQRQKLRNCHWCQTVMITAWENGLQRRCKMIDLESLPMWLVTPVANRQCQRRQERGRRLARGAWRHPDDPRLDIAEVSGMGFWIALVHCLQGTSLSTEQQFTITSHQSAIESPKRPFDKHKPA